VPLPTFVTRVLSSSPFVGKDSSGATCSSSISSFSVSASYHSRHGEQSSSDAVITSLSYSKFLLESSSEEDQLEYLGEEPTSWSDGGTGAPPPPKAPSQHGDVVLMGTAIHKRGERSFCCELYRELCLLEATSCSFI
jgi:hypothetical protein